MDDREAERLPSAAGAIGRKGCQRDGCRPTDPPVELPEASIVALPRIEPGACAPIPERQGGDRGWFHLGIAVCARRETAVSPLDGTQLSIESCVEALQLHARMVPPAARSQFVPRSSPD